MSSSKKTTRPKKGTLITSDPIMNQQKNCIIVRIKQLMEMFHVNLSDIARLLDLNPSTFYRLLTGEHKMISIKYLIILSDTFAVSLSWLCGAAEFPSPISYTLKDREKAREKLKQAIDNASLEQLQLIDKYLVWARVFAPSSASEMALMEVTTDVNNERGK